MEYVATITLNHAGDTDDADALLDAFLAGHAQASPVVGKDLQAETIDVTFAVDAHGGYEAFELAREVFAAATVRTRFARPVVGVTDQDVAEPTEKRARLVLDRYMAAFEQSDMAALEALLANDAILEMTGTATWFLGKGTCVPFIAAQAIGDAGDWRMLPIDANGQLAVAAYHLGNGGSYHAFAVVVLATTLTHLAHIALFVDPGLFSRFGLPPTISAEHRLGTSN